MHVADLLTVDATLKVGAITDEVTVTAIAATVDRTTAELGQVVDARRIAELPIREGSPVELVILAPGVTVTTDLRSRKAAFNNGLSQFSTDGVGEKKNDFTIDGVSNVANDRVAYSPPSASVEEFKIHTTSYDAAIGNTMGAVVNLVTKSGTNNVPRRRPTSGSAARRSTRATTSTSAPTGRSATTRTTGSASRSADRSDRTGRSTSPTSRRTRSRCRRRTS